MWQNYPTTAPILQTTFDKAEDYREDWITEIKSYGDEMHHRTNLKCQMTTYTSVLYNPLFLPLVDFIDRSCESYQDTSTPPPYPPVEMWGAIYKKGEEAITHNHIGSTLSFCYYVSVDNKSSPFVFRDIDLSIQPYNGLMILFPSHLYHYVPKQEEDNERVIIAGNVKC